MRDGRALAVARGTSVTQNPNSLQPDSTSHCAGVVEIAGRVMSSFALWMWTNAPPRGFLDSRLCDGIPVLAKDFSQSWEDGPRMLPSMYARPGQRVQPTT